MAEGPLNESEMAWLEETLISYGHDDASVIDVSELDGMLTAVLSGPVVVEPDTGWWRSGVVRNIFLAGKTIVR